MLMSLSEKYAVVTGGTGALGSVIAGRLAREGAAVFVTYRREEELRGFSSGSTRSIATIKADLTVEADVRQLYEQIISRAGRVDIIVNAVGGFLPRKPITEVTLAEWDSMMEVNLKSTFLSTREALRRMQRQAYGRIINISAMVGLNPTAGRAPYAISKAGVSLLTDVVAQEQKGSGITVNAIAPSIIATPSNLASMPGEDSSKWVKPEEIADLVVYLCSEPAGAITGTTFKAYGRV
jgi:NAD(P)-dependent dehydrogenase (short-subunit alcohol dehydrogenase family)